MNNAALADFDNRLSRQREFLEEKRGNLLVFAFFTEGRTPVGCKIEGQTGTLSTAFLDQHARDLGFQHVRAREAEALDHFATGDDFISGLSPANWGSGFKIGLFGNGDVIFQEETAYETETAIKTWDDLDSFRFDPGNRWVAYLVESWRGIEAAYEGGLVVQPFSYKSPLDLANGLRGNDLFTDLYDAPEQVERLLGWCVDSIVTLDKFLRDRFPLLDTAPNGVWGGMPRPRAMWLNGDPVDLISEEFGDRFNRPPIEKLADYAGGIWFHHHSIGHTRAGRVSRTRGITIQNIQQDPNGPRLLEVIDDRLIEASHRTPINLNVNLAESPHMDRLLERLAEGRFIVEVRGRTKEEARALVEKVRRHAR